MKSGLLTQNRARLFGSILGATILVFSVLTLVAGLPPGDKSGFITGLIVLFVVTAGIGVVGWYLMLRPLPGGATVATRRLSSTRERHVVALLLSLGMFGFGIAGVWDEVWHSKYGIPFGEDFFWRPHLLLYFGFSCLIGVGLWSWWVMMRRGTGSLQRRFRTEPILGATVLLSAYTVYAISADPIWHWMYGADLAPWSVPHLLILMVMLTAVVVAVGYHRSVMPQREWRARVDLAWRDVLIGLVLVGVLMAFVLVFTIEWYAASTNPELMAEILRYPDWLFSVFLTFLATMFGALALHATRRVGTATMVGLLTLGQRFVLDTVLDGESAGTLPIWLMLPVFVALDVWYAVSIRRAGQPPSVWSAAGVAALAFAVVGVPLLAVLFEHPPVTAATVPGMVIAGAVGAVGGVGLGRLLGESAGEPGEARRAEQEPQAEPARLTTNLVYAGYLVFLVLFVTTAVPPTG
jgi:hypothetical protein